MSEAPELTAVRDGHEFDEDALDEFMRAEISGYRGGLRVEQFEGGQSNPTFLLHSDGPSYVMRKQPPGELLPSAHQVDREFKVMKALEATPVPVPTMYAYSEDTAVVGTKFYIMEHVAGRVFLDVTMPTVTRDEREALYDELAGVLAYLHNVSYTDVGLEEFGRPGNYYTRQISRWSKQYVASKTEDIPSMDRLMEWLPENIPQTEQTMVVHGDYRLGNVIVDPSAPKISAVLDWELSTLGHGLADLGYICQSYHTPADDPMGLDRPDLNELGIPSEEAFVARYCELAGLPGIDDWNFYIVYNLFRSAAIVQGVYKRGLDGNASSDRALNFKEHCRVRGDKAWSLVTERS
ncbi:MAG: phosphotransferase [Gammaproteobacteria bacterium]|nr:phosphotransferase [Gammaproteobacteria bacterium]